jgi:hypothetical protein
MAVSRLTAREPHAAIDGEELGTDRDRVQDHDLREAPRLSPSGRRQAFLAELGQMSEEERVRAARHGSFSRWERSIWAAQFPEQVPLVNGEVEWIALRLADLD